ncbi:MAG TPA: ferritin-like domain-containing protein [Solirubrobacteraceae bacterium]|nr:ferritin-like domain-containing protein [Solirubrobacteraceae bacterium]
MQSAQLGETRRWTRGRALRAAAAGGAAVGGGMLLGRRLDTRAGAAPTAAGDEEILGFFLQLEQVQDGLYRAAQRSGHLSGALQDFVRTVQPQEAEHVEFLTSRAGRRARARPRSDFSDAVRSEETFHRAAIELEELTLAAYIGQGANLTRATVADVAKLVSVEARQAAWLRDLAGEDPAPRAADPPQKPDDVLAALRQRSYIL